jgi:polysaccharide export outer membrane protein
MVSRAILAAAALAVASCAGAQRPPAPQPVSGTARVAALTPAPAAAEVNRKLLGQLTPAEESGDLPLGAGDLVEVSVFDVQELSSLKLRIPNSGNITLPLIGTVPAAGLSAVELQGAIRARLQEKYMHDPQVSLFVHEHKSQRISVVGAVRTGGVFTLTSRLRLADALAMAGGLGDEAGSTVYLIRRAPAENNGATEQVMTTIDLERLVAGRQELNLPLQAGDVIEVPRAGSFYVGGEVNRPGSFLLKSRTTLDQVPAVAGGVKDGADWDDIRVYRARPDGTRDVMTFSLNEFEKGNPAPEVQANDVVVVGKSYLKAFLYGVKDFFHFGVGAAASVPIP